MINFRLNIPDPLADERRLLGHALSNAYQSVMFDLLEHFPEADLKPVVQECVETAMVRTLDVFDGARTAFGGIEYVVLPASMVEHLDGEWIIPMPNLAGGLAEVLKKDFERINS